MRIKRKIKTKIVLYYLNYPFRKRSFSFFFHFWWVMGESEKERERGGEGERIWEKTFESSLLRIQNTNKIALLRDDLWLRISLCHDYKKPSMLTFSVVFVSPSSTIVTHCASSISIATIESLDMVREMLGLFPLTRLLS